MTPRPKSMMTPVSMTQVNIKDNFWSPRIRTNRNETIPHAYRQCKETGRIDAFDLKWEPGDEPVPHYFWDSDVAKWIEAASYSLAAHPDPKLDALLDEVIEKIAGAQQPNGYLNVYFTVVKPEARWHNLGMWHELYCAGHLIEAAAAHYGATGKRQLLDVVCRYADHIDSVFGPAPNQRSGAPGHQGIELALVKLYKITGNQRYLNLSKFFLEQRGQNPSVFQLELENLSSEDAELNRHFFQKKAGFDTRYCQDHLPVKEQTEVVGHAVRAMYMYCGMVDVAVETEDDGLLEACRRLWENVCQKRMYVTGGIGPSRDNEGFTEDYDLPNETAYAETCAAVGLIFWNHRLLHAEGRARYADIMEKALYNGALAGISLNGREFFYVNPLASSGAHHRQEWFGCACCPPNIARLIASLGGYIYSESDSDAYIHLYISGQGMLRTADTQVLISQTSSYPWDGLIDITIQPKRPAVFSLNLRIPGWCRKAALWVNGDKMNLDGCIKHGYARVYRKWLPGDEVRLELDMPVERVRAHPNVKQNQGCVALARGPILFCLEEADNPAPLHRLILPKRAKFKTIYNGDTLGGIVKLQTEALFTEDTDWSEGLYRFQPPKTHPCLLTAIPYYAWDHRAPGEMQVWIREGGE